MFKFKNYLFKNILLNIIIIIIYSIAYYFYFGLFFGFLALQIIRSYREFLSSYWKNVIENAGMNFLCFFFFVHGLVLLINFSHKWISEQMFLGYKLIIGVILFVSSIIYAFIYIF